MTPEATLARTTSLINEQFFDRGADERAITAGLMATTVRLVADEQNMSCRAGQAALVTTFQLVARMGIGIELIAPEVELLPRAPALRGSTLRAALLDLGEDLIPGAIVREDEEHADLTLVFGDTPYISDEALRVSVSDLGARITRAEGKPARIDCEYPLDALAAGAAAAAITLKSAMANIEHAAGVARTSRPLPNAGPPVNIDLTHLFPSLPTGPIDLERVDIISAGAAANALINVLLWLPGISADTSVLDDDPIDWHNLNRCPQFRAKDVKAAKVDVLAAAATDAFRITGVNARFQRPSDGDAAALAKRVAVGVDRIEARWWVQQSWPENLYIAATSLYEATVTTHHPGEACAGCAHPDAAPPAENIPTISFVSYWAGLLQACALLSEAVETQPARRLVVYPFALGEPAWSLVSNLRPVGNCPIFCPASREISAHR